MFPFVSLENYYPAAPQPDPVVVNVAVCVSRSTYKNLQPHEASLKHWRLQGPSANTQFIGVSAKISGKMLNKETRGEIRRVDDGTYRNLKSGLKLHLSFYKFIYLYEVFLCTRSNPIGVHNTIYTSYTKVPLIVALFQ